MLWWQWGRWPPSRWTSLPGDPVGPCSLGLGHFDIFWYILIIVRAFLWTPVEVSPYSDYANLLLAAFGTFWRNRFSTRIWMCWTFLEILKCWYVMVCRIMMNYVDMVDIYCERCGCSSRPVENAAAAEDFSQQWVREFRAKIHKTIGRCCAEHGDKVNGPHGVSTRALLLWQFCYRLQKLCHKLSTSVRRLSCVCGVHVWFDLKSWLYMAWAYELARSMHPMCWCHTHTCSEISYRITVVECIGRAQTIP